MFEITKILKRSFHILWNYRMLWVFAFILAAVSSGGSHGSGSSSYRDDDNRERPTRNNPAGMEWREWDELAGKTPQEKLTNAMQLMLQNWQKLQEKFPVETRMGIGLVVTALVLFILLGIIATILRYVAETAIMRMVNDYEETGLKIGFRQGWKYGWSGTAWRVFLADFIIHLPSLGLLVILGLCAWWIIGNALNGVSPALITSLVAGVGLSFVAILVTTVVMVVLYVVRDLAWRYTVVEGVGVREALGLGWGLLRRQWKNVGLMWLVMIGMKFAWGIVFFVLVFPLLVLSAVTVIGGVIAAIVPALLTAGIASFFAPDFWPWAFAALVSLPFFLIVTFSPIIFVEGWGLLYESNVWTLTYRELKVVEAVKAE